MICYLESALSLLRAIYFLTVTLYVHEIEGMIDSSCENIA